MATVEKLLSSIEFSRDIYIKTIGGLSKEATNHKPTESSWDVVEITEHLILGRIFRSSSHG